MGEWRMANGEWQIGSGRPISSGVILEEDGEVKIYYGAAGMGEGGYGAPPVRGPCGDGEHA
jgi:hypothetical protein